MKKFIGFLLITLTMATGALFLAPDESQAVPAFARQTGQACQSCHFDGNFPLLNAFGREFKAGGLTMVGGESLIEGELLSIPAVLNAAVVGKFRYVKPSNEHAVLDMPDELALFLAGRVGENVGIMMEIPIAGDAAGHAVNLRMPFVFKVGEGRISVVPFRTDDLGPSFGFELLNTGMQGNQKSIERANDTSAARYIGVTKGNPGVGFAFVASHSIGYISYTAWQTETNGDQSIKLGSYVRGVVTRQVGDWDLAGGLAGYFGTINSGGGTDAKTKAWVIDGQAQGQVGSMPLGIYASYASAGKSDAGGTANLFNSSTTNDKTAFAISGTLSVIPKRVALTAGYRAGKVDGQSDNALVLAAQYHFTQNIKLELDWESFSGVTKDEGLSNKTTIMMFTAF